MLIPRSQNGVFSCLSISTLRRADRNYTIRTENGVVLVCVALANWGFPARFDRNYTNRPANGVITVKPQEEECLDGRSSSLKSLNNVSAKSCIKVCIRSSPKTLIFGPDGIQTSHAPPQPQHPRAHLLLEASATALNNGNAGRSWMRMGVFVASQSGMHQLG